MAPNPALGVLLHAIGGYAAGCFYIPLKKVRNWAWESYWLANGIFAWLIAPLVVASIMNRDLFGIIGSAPRKAILWTYFFGLLWGIGGMTYGLTMRYLGLSLGVAISLGFCATFGTLIPPIFDGTIVEMLRTLPGWIVIGGIVVCLLGIAICGYAGTRKERELPGEDRKKTISEYNFRKGVWVAALAGVMSACFAYGFVSGRPIADLAVDAGTKPMWQNTPVLVVILWGGFTTNFLWCLFLNIKNGTIRDYTDKKSPLVPNYFFAGLAGITWYFQFFFYSMGTTKMGRYDFSSWTLHMAFIIIFGNIWGILLKEWKGTSAKTHQILVIGIIVLCLSTVIVGYGNYLAAK